MANPQFVSCPGIVLKKFPYGEADEIISVLLKEEGVVRFFVAGSRKSKKRFGGLIDLFAHLDFHYLPNSRGLWRLSGVSEKKPFALPATGRDLLTYAFASFFAEQIIGLIPDAQGDHGLYDFWLRALEGDFSKSQNKASFISGALLSLLDKAGFSPQLRRCVSCSALATSRPHFFDAKRGGVVCDHCQAMPGNLVPLSEKILWCLSGETLKIDDADPSWMVFLRQLLVFLENIRQQDIKTADFLLEALAAQTKN